MINYSEIIRQFNEKPIAYYPIYRKITGSTTAGILLSQLMYWFSKKDKFYKTDREIIEETLLTIDELKSAKKKIKKLSFIEVTIEGIPAKTWYRIDWDKFILELDSLCKSQQPVGGNPTNCDVEIPQTITKTTTKTTTNNKERNIEARSQDSLTSIQRKKDKAIRKEIDNNPSKALTKDSISHSPNSSSSQDKDLDTVNDSIQSETDIQANSVYKGVEKKSPKKKIGKKDKLIDEVVKKEDAPLTDREFKLLNRFYDYRKEIGKPVKTFRALKGFLKNIREIEKEGYDLDEAIELMEEREWMTITKEYCKRSGVRKETDYTW